jgi:deazaflavin-dependent oxidoreductase (nitroreductase family)
MTNAQSKNWLQRTVIRFAVSFVGAALGSRLMHHLDRLALRWSHGRFTLTTLLTGLEVLCLTTTGAKSGQPRTVPLLAIPHRDGQFILIASNWGQANNPGWYYNILAHPQVTVTRNGRTQPYQARETSGVERERCWQIALQTYPGYAAYKRRTSRRIPVILLSPQPPDNTKKAPRLKGFR